VQAIGRQPQRNPDGAPVHYERHRPELEFMQRLAALVPRPRLLLIRFHGVLAPNAKLRPLVVPQEQPAQAQAASELAAGGDCEIETVPAWSHSISWARLLKRVLATT
jgi:hypothetical protein